jgi:hypothetical protein
VLECKALAGQVPNALIRPARRKRLVSKSQVPTRHPSFVLSLCLVPETIKDSLAFLVA